MYFFAAQLSLKVPVWVLLHISCVSKTWYSIPLSTLDTGDPHLRIVFVANVPKTVAATQKVLCWCLLMLLYLEYLFPLLPPTHPFRSAQGTISERQVR